MLVVRAVKPEDIDDLIVLAKKAGSGMTSLPPCKETLLGRIALSQKSFTNGPGNPDDYFLMVMEDTEAKKVVGTAGVHARTGSRQAFYAYRLMSANHYSHSLGKEVRSGLLHLTNDYTDCSEVGTLFIDPDYRGNGHWLAKARYLLMGQFPNRFAPYVIAELRGWINEENASPFWEAIGRQFFDMDYEEADQLCGVGSNQFITELMPKYPIYTQLLPEEARNVIGKPHPAGQRAMELLMQEGFSYENVVDIFDGGPMLRAKVDCLQSIRSMEQGSISSTEQTIHNDSCIIGNTRINNFRVVNTPAIRSKNGIIKTSSKVFEQLQVDEGELIKVVTKR
ncbi:MAG: arginine N-succinyltransferase [Cellvibrionaceae bacterium]